MTTAGEGTTRQAGSAKEVSVAHPLVSVKICLQARLLSSAYPQLTISLQGLVPLGHSLRTQNASWLQGLTPQLHHAWRESGKFGSKLTACLSTADPARRSHIRALRTVGRAAASLQLQEAVCED